VDGIEIRDIPTNYSYKFSGTVTSARSGANLSGCSPNGWSSAESAINLLTVEREVDGKTESYDIAYQLDGAATSFVKGDSIDVDYAFEEVWGGFGLPRRSLVLQGKTREKYVYIAQATDVSGLAKGPVTFALGDLNLECAHACGTIKRYNLLVNNAGDKLQIPPGEAASVDPARLVYNSYAQTLGTVATAQPCMDWSPSGVSVAIVPLIPLL
jgi:hypothetical protein